MYSGIEGLKSSQDESNLSLWVVDLGWTDTKKWVRYNLPTNMVPVAATETMVMPTQIMLL